MKELWDLYDEDRNLTGKVHERGTWIDDGFFHLVVHIWIKNKDGKYLISRRDKSRKDNPLLLECQGGSVLAGESSLDGAIRETKEEVGIDLTNVPGKLIYTKIRRHFHDIMDVWLFEYDGEVDLSKATTNEVCEVMWMSKEEIKKAYDTKELVQTLDYFFELKGEEYELYKI